MFVIYGRVLLTVQKSAKKKPVKSKLNHGQMELETKEFGIWKNGHSLNIIVQYLLYRKFW